jgi:hypothetical protein
MRYIMLSPYKSWYCTMNRLDNDAIPNYLVYVEQHYGSRDYDEDRLISEKTSRARSISIKLMSIMYRFDELEEK